MQSTTPSVFLLKVWPLSRSLATTSEISVDFSSSPYLDVSVQAVPLPILFGSYRDTKIWLFVDCSIRISTDQSLLATPRSFSQLTASFIGLWCQGIRPAPFVAWPFFWNYAFSNLRSVLFPLSRIDNLFEIVVFLPKTFVLRIKTFDFFTSRINIIFDQFSRSHSFPKENCLSTTFRFVLGGHKWTRTTDLTLIRRAL